MVVGQWGTAYIKDHSVTDEEFDAAVEEAMEYVRHRKQ